MIASILTFLLFSISIIFFMCVNPLSIGIVILLISLCATCIVSFFISSWLCFLIFLIYISGILVLFSYFVAITPNMQIPSLIINATFLFLIPAIFMVFMFYPNKSPILFQPEPYISFMYISPANVILLILAFILLVTIIIVVKIIIVKGGPLRPFILYV